MSQIQCSNCNSYKTLSETKSYKIKVTTWCFIFGLLLYYMGYINETASAGFIMLIAVCLLGVSVVFLVFTFTHRTDRFKCKSCGYKWEGTITNDEPKDI